MQGEWHEETFGRTLGVADWVYCLRQVNENDYLAPCEKADNEYLTG